MPTTLSRFFPRHCSRNKSIDSRNKIGSFKTGVMSLNTIPFFGKSGTSRTAARSFSTVSESIGANASGTIVQRQSGSLWQPCMNCKIVLATGVAGTVAEIANWTRQPKIDCPSGALSSHCFYILLSRRGWAHRHRATCGSVPPDAIQFLRHRIGFHFPDGVLVDARPGVGTMPDYKPV